MRLQAVVVGPRTIAIHGMSVLEVATYVGDGQLAALMESQWVPCQLMISVSNS